MRRTATLLTAALLVGGLTACGGGDDADDGAQATGTTDCRRDRIATTQAVAGSADDPTTYRIVLTDDTLAGASPVTGDGVIATDPTFSPGGGRLAYVHHVGPEVPYGVASTIWTIGVDGTDPQRVTGGLDWSEDPADHRGEGEGAAATGPWDIEPDWSPTEEVIVFTRVGPTSPGTATLRRLFTVVPGQDPAPLLADAAAQGFAPAWSPDGTQIAFLRGDRTTSALTVWVVGRDGKGARKVADTGDASELVWSPDGATLSVGGKSGVGTHLPLRLITVADGATTVSMTSGAALGWSTDGLRFYMVNASRAGTATFHDVLHVAATVDGEFQVESPTNSLALFQRPELDGLDVTDCPN